MVKKYFYPGGYWEKIEKPYVGSLQMYYRMFLFSVTSLKTILKLYQYSVTNYNYLKYPTLDYIRKSIFFKLNFTIELNYITYTTDEIKMTKWKRKIDQTKTNYLWWIIFHFII